MRATTEKEGGGGADVVFECPQCGKSLVIDARGAGLVVTCPGCAIKMQVPVPEADGPGNTSLADYTHSPAAARAGGAGDAAQRMEVRPEDLQARREYLETYQQESRRRTERLREEMAAIQSALDRMVDILQ